MTNSEFLSAIMNYLKNHAPDQDKYHYWLLKMDDGVSSRIIRAPAQDPGQADKAREVVAGTYGLYVSNTVNPRGNPDGKFIMFFSSTQADDEGHYSAGYHYLADKNYIAIAAEAIVQYLEDGKMPPEPQ